MVKQHTILNSTSAKGVGLHSGKLITINLRPAAINTGIVFVRNDLQPPVNIAALESNVSDTTLSTTISCDGAKISTVEHLLAALSGLGIDNIYIDVDGDEIPIMDGSAAHFVFLIQAGGIKEQQAAKYLIRVKKNVFVTDGEKRAELHPFNGFQVSFAVDFDHPAFKFINNKDSTLDFSSSTFIREISRARTFGFMKDMETLRANNLALGGSEKNAIVLDDTSIMHNQSLRYSDEFVKHKILDAIGDLSLLGKSLLGSFYGFKSGHALNNNLIRALLKDTQAWDLVTFDDVAKSPIKYSGMCI